MTILIIIIIIIAIPLTGAASLSNDYIIEREIVINKPKDEVFNYIKFIGNHINFNKWTMADPNVRTEFKGIDGTVGFVYTWNSDVKNVGQGEQEIIKIVEGSSFDTALHFIKPFEGRANSSMHAEAMPGGQTKVKWRFTGLRNYPNKIMHFLLNLKKMLGNDLQLSLNNLKNVLEK